MRLGVTPSGESRYQRLNSESVRCWCPWAWDFAVTPVALVAQGAVHSSQIDPVLVAGAFRTQLDQEV
ncbi:MAG: hypothetical protein QOF66_6071 [Mycobacterium sp.]|jgi:hypothetical protein|nr:hypothetical protein [Mycobacterium sp.]